jgi:hypothetical protein
VNTIEFDRRADEHQFDKKPPPISSLQDLTLIEAWDSDTNQPKYVTFYHIINDEHVFFGQSFKNKREITLAEYSAGLEAFSDEEPYPKIPQDVKLKIEPDDLDPSSTLLSDQV